MQRQGLPESATTCLFNMIQKARHHVKNCTWDTLGGNDVIQVQRLFQGNGAGPPIWVVLSTPILDIQIAADLGSFITTAITQRTIRLISFSFVNDTNTI